MACGRHHSRPKSELGSTNRITGRRTGDTAFIRVLDGGAILATCAMGLGRSASMESPTAASSTAKRLMIVGTLDGSRQGPGNVSGGGFWARARRGGNCNRRPIPLKCRRLRMLRWKEPPASHARLALVQRCVSQLAAKDAVCTVGYGGGGISECTFTTLGTFAIPKAWQGDASGSRLIGAIPVKHHCRSVKRGSGALSATAESRLIGISGDRARKKNRTVGA